MNCMDFLMEKINEEIKDADSYAQMALEQQHDNRETADLLMTLAGEELRHRKMLTDELRRIAGDEMPDRYEKMLNESIKNAAVVKAKEIMYNE